MVEEEQEQQKRGLFGRLFGRDEVAEESSPGQEQPGEESGPADEALPPSSPEEEQDSAESIHGPVVEDGAAAEIEDLGAPRRGLLARMFGRRDEEETPEDEPAVEVPVEAGDQLAAPLSSVAADGEHESVAGTTAEELVEPSLAAEPVVEETPGEGDAATGEPGAEPVEADSRGLFGRLRQGLTKTRQGLVQKVDRALLGKKEIDADTLDELEEALVTADLGVQTSMRLIEGIQEKVSRKELTSPEALREHLRAEIHDILVADEGQFKLGAERPQVLLVVGVNGVGKTTTIGKIAAQYRDRGHKVMLAAGDTFRAAAIEQLQIWGARAGAQVVRHEHGSDPAAVAFDAVEAAKARGVDLVIVDTAGRLHTKNNLMEELKKVKRVIGKAMVGAPHQVLLVLDATTGQNAISQAKVFDEAVGVDGIALTKLDGTAKGGVIVGICDELKVPVQFVGIGEQIADLRPFDAEEFVAALF